MNTKMSILKKIWLPLLALLLYTPWSGKSDLFTSQFFYRDNHFTSHSFFDFFYDYAIYLAWIVVAVSLFIVALSLFMPSLKKWRQASLYLILTLGLGAGVIVHAVLKDHWGRPRPRQTIEFGGNQPFRPYYQPNFFHQPEPSKSFPCGHCSMGFYFFAVAILGSHYKQKKVYYLGMSLAWGLGILLGLTRIAQGGHFLSDVVVSALIMWLVSVGLYHFLFKLQRVQK